MPLSGSLAREVLGATTDAVDAALGPLVQVLADCANGRVTVIALEGAISALPLLPAHLHIRWPDAVAWLPLTATVAIVPFNATAMAPQYFPLYKVGDARETRRAARIARNDASRARPGDFQHPDWEMSDMVGKGHLDQTVLPARSFLSIERVQPDGSARNVSRPILGRHAKRDAARPRLIVPGGRKPSAKEIEVLANTDLLLVDLQRLRGSRALHLASKVLAARGVRRPTLIVASSPSDLLALGFEDPAMCGRLTTVGKPPQLERVLTALVGRERLAADHQFSSSLSGLSDQSDAAAVVVRLAESAWWATKQAIAQDSGLQERRRFENALENLTKADAYVAGGFTACRDLIRAAANDQGAREERARVSLEAICAPGVQGPTLVLTRTLRDATALRHALSRHLDLAESELETLEINIRSTHGVPAPILPGTTVLVGYSGMSTIDSALVSRARAIRAVFDPVEARVAWINAQRMASYLIAADAKQAAVPYEILAKDLAPVATGGSDTLELGLEGSLRQEMLQRISPVERPSPGQVLIYLADGSSLTVAVAARFEVLGRNGFGSRVRAAAELVPGDQIVLLDEEAHSLFSERRIAALDTGPLKAQVASRSAWLALARAVAKARKMSAVAIANAMRELGHPITSAAVGSWLSDDSDVTCAPMSLERFKALAQVLGVQLPAEDLGKYYRDIHDLRVRHRKAGRDVAQAIRLAYSGRLGAESLARVESNWGVAVRALVAAAQVGVVDDVLLPEGDNVNA